MPLLNESDTIHFLCRGYVKPDIDVLLRASKNSQIIIVRFISGKLFGDIGWLS
jgi:hypothetical protein